MTIRNYRCAVRRAVSILLLAAGAMVLESFASPVLIGDADDLIAPPGGEGLPDIGLRAERRAAAVDPSTLPLPVTIDEIRGDESAPGRRPGWDGTPLNRLGAWPGLPGSYGSVFGQGESLRDQLLRDFGSAGASPAGEQTAGTNQLRRGDDRGAVTPAQAMMWEAVDNALKLIRDSVVDESELVSFSVVGVDFNLTLSGGRSSLVVTSDLWPAVAQVLLGDEVRPESVARASATAPGAGSGMHGVGGPSYAQSTALPPETAPDAAPGQGAVLIYEKIRDFVTDPMTIVAVFGSLIVWLTYEFSSAVRERRRWRRARRRAMRAQARAQG